MTIFSHIAKTRVIVAYVSKVIHKAFQFRIYPTKDQERFLDFHFGACRFVYNHFLVSKIEKFETLGIRSNVYDDCKELTGLRKKLPWLKKIGRHSLEASVENLDDAFKKFFKRKSKFPKFHRRKNEQTFKVRQSIFIENDKLWIPKLKKKGGIKIAQHQDLKGKIVFCTIRKVPSGRYYASITCEDEQQPLKKSDKKIGIDFGLKTFITTSDGEKVQNPDFYEPLKKKIKFQQRRLSKKQKGSKNREKARLNLAKTHQKMNDQKKNFLHQLSRRLIDENQVICLETLNVAGMMKNHKLAGSIQRASWGEFVRQLTYKAKWAEREIIKIGTFFPSSKTCSNCGFKLEEMNLKIREWDCPQCHVCHDRDHNAAKNILTEGLRIQKEMKKQSASGTDDTDSKQKPMEASSSVFLPSKVERTRRAKEVGSAKWISSQQ